MNIFEKAVRLKIRFASDRGLLSVEQLFDLKLPQLDVVAKAVNVSLKGVAEQSFISSAASNPNLVIFETQMELVKAVIAEKLAEVDAAKKRAENRRKKAELLEALDQKDSEERKNMSRDQIEKALADLD